MSAGAPLDHAARLAEAAREIRLRWSVSAHALRLTTLAVTGLVIAVITRRPEFAGVAAPPVLLLAARRPARPARIGLRVRPSAPSVVEGEQAGLDVTVSGHGDHRVELLVYPRFAVVPDPGQSLRAGASSSLSFHMSRSGRRSLGDLEITLRDRLGLTAGRATLELPVIDCYPRPAQQRTRVLLSRLPSRLGEHPTRAPGEGAEFTGLRDFTPGDRQRRINWPATTRRARLQLNTFAAERTQNVVIIADATADVGEAGSTPADLALRGSAAVARAYLAVRDRVGFVRYQRGLAWIAPGLGARHYYRIMDLMLAAPVLPGASPPGAELTRLPRAALPPGALIVVFSPLLDRHLVETVRDLRERGFSLLIIDVLNAEPPGGRDSESRLARRIWRMEQEAIRFSLRELGIALVAWDGEQSLDEPLAPYTRRVMVSHR
jgi:uncharacterized protein (DUF58 family)